MTTTPIPAPTDDDTVPPSSKAIEERAEIQREQVVAEDANRTWHGLPLKPWSEERQLLLDRLVAGDIPMPDETTADAESFYHGLFPWAVKALYLALHEPRDWDPLRSRLISHIESWGVADYIPPGLDENQLKSFIPERQNVPCGTLSEKAEAVNLVYEMINAHRKIMALRRTRRMKGGAAEGN